MRKDKIAIYKHFCPLYTAEKELAKRTGQKVQVLRKLTRQECDEEYVGKMYLCKWEDGYIADVFKDELTFI